MNTLNKIAESNSTSNFIKYRTVRKICDRDYMLTADSDTARQIENPRNDVDKQDQRDGIEDFPNVVKSIKESRPVEQTQTQTENTNKSVNPVPEKKKSGKSSQGFLIKFILLLFVLSFGIAFLSEPISNMFKKNTFEQAIQDKSLTYEMCHDSDGKYVNFMMSDEREEIVENYLDEYYKNYDYESAFWLLTVAGTGYHDIKISDEYRNWLAECVVNYGTEINGISFRDDPTVTYELEDYTVTLYYRDGELDSMEVKDSAGHDYR